MSDSRIQTTRPGIIGWLAAAAAVLLFVTASAGLFLLLWKYVPTQAARFAALDVTPPLSARVVIEASRWTTPLLIIVGVPVFCLVGVSAVAVAVRRGSRRAIGVTTAIVFALAVVELIGAAAVIYSVRGAPVQPESDRQPGTGAP